MNILPWTPDYSIGVFSLDEQHQQMLLLVNQLFESLLQGTCARRIDGFIEELMVKSRAHFAQEETIMAETGFPGMAAHKEKHADYLKTIADYQIRARDAAGTLEMYDLTRELSHYLKEWITAHICVEDRALGRHLNQKGIH